MVSEKFCFKKHAVTTGTQTALATSSMLTLIAYRIPLAAYVPKLPYMTRLDYFTLLGTLLVFLALIEVSITSILAHTDRTDLARKIDRLSRVSFPVLFALVSIWSFAS